MRAIVIPQSKGKLFLLVIGALAFVAAGIWIWSNASQVSQASDDSPIAVQTVALLSITFFGACALAGIHSLLDHTPGLVIDADGIVDNSTAVSVGRIPWHDITGIEVRYVQTQRYITIRLADPQQYIARSTGIKRYLLKASYGMTGSPVNIPSTTLSRSFDELLRTLTTTFEEQRKAARLPLPS